LKIPLLQGNAATHLRRGGKFYSTFFCSSYQNARVKELLNRSTLTKAITKRLRRVFLTRGILTLQKRILTKAI